MAEQTQPSETVAVQRLHDIQQELVKGWIAGDRPTIERLLAPDWCVTGPTGTVSTRAEVLGDFFERRVHRLLSGRVTDIAVRLVGTDAAVVTGRTRATGTYTGTPYDADIHFTDIFERHGTDWRAVRSHASSITKR
jgi:ketosteroid isomerase-like protein